MYKRGQFFLIAGLVVIILIFGLATVYNYVNVNPDEEVFYDLSKEIDFETSKVIEQGIISNQEGGIEVTIRNLITTYGQQNPDSDIYIIYGSSNNVKSMYFESVESGSTSVGGAGNQIRERELENGNVVYNPQTGKYSVEIGNKNYEFDIKEGENFYVVLKKEKDGETFVAQD